jgi:hypothetical protein
VQWCAGEKPLERPYWDLVSQFIKEAVEAKKCQNESKPLREFDTFFGVGSGTGFAGKRFA